MDKTVLNGSKTLTSDLYIQTIIPLLLRHIEEHKQHLVETYQMRCEPGDEYEIVLLQDNAPIHKAKKVIAALEEAGIKCLDFPPYSPDLNPIEGIWATLKRRIYSRNPRPKKRHEVEAAVREEWEKLSYEDVMDVCDTMPERIQKVLEANGGPTRW